MNLYSKSFFLIALCLAFLTSSCGRDPVTGRRRIALVPTPVVNSLAAQEYDNFLETHQVVRGTPEARSVQEVGTRIQRGTEDYLRQQNMLDRVRGYDWEFNLVQSSEVNAWAMPGGKIVIYTGILPIAQDDTGLAVIMGHEVAHAVLGHGQERLTQGLLTQLGGMALSEALSQRPEQTRELFMQAYGATTQIGVLLPYSRLHEREADRYGLIFMAMAGYDPRAAVDFWQRMMTASDVREAPAFLRTHPPTAQRIEDIRALLPEALRYYRPRQ